MKLLPCPKCKETVFGPIYTNLISEGEPLNLMKYSTIFCTNKKCGHTKKTLYNPEDPFEIDRLWNEQDRDMGLSPHGHFEN